MTELLVICGPTGSGKTAFAHEIALRKNGEIINCDSQQIYKEIPILTASPLQDLQTIVPYHLYNFLPVCEEFSVAKYIYLAAEQIKQVISRGKLPIITGGTGMYINSLLYGYNHIPEISTEVKEQARTLQSSLNQQDFYEYLKNIDPKSCIKIKPNDIQRTLRAYEVFKQTGESIVVFQERENVLPLSNINFKVVFLNPERHLLYQICNDRLIDIFNNGAIDEVKTIKDNFYKLTNSASKAIGIRELLAYLDNQISIVEATTLAQQRTRRYAKRQVTWFNHQIKEKTILKYSSLDEFEKLRNTFCI